MSQTPALVAFVWADSDVVIDEAFLSPRRRSRRKPSQVSAFIAARGPQSPMPARRDAAR